MVTIYIGENKDACIKIAITPMYRLEVLFELSPKVRLDVNYYVAPQKSPIHTIVLLEARKQRTSGGACDWWKLWGRSAYEPDDVAALIKAMEDNSIFHTDCLWWDAETTTLCLGLVRSGEQDHDVMKLSTFELCDDAKHQFIEEFKRLRQIYGAMGNKIRLCARIRSNHLVN